MMRLQALCFAWIGLAYIAGYTVRAANDETAYISSTDGGLLKALQNRSIARIVLTSDYSVKSDRKVGYSAYPLSRDVTVTAESGVVLDLDFEPELLHLCSTCHITFVNITIANARRGTGDGFDGIAGDPGSAVFMQNVVRLRIACIPAADTAAVISNTPRSKLLPGSSNKQRYDIRSVTYQDKMYPDTLLMLDYTTDQPLSLQEFRGHFGGVALSQQNVTRVCLNTVSDSCLRVKSPEACVNDLIDAVTAESQPASGGLGPGTLAAVITIPVVLAGGLVILGVVLLMRRRSRQRQQLLPELVKQTSGVSGDSYAPPHALWHADSAMESALQRKISIEVRIVKQEQQQLPLGGRPDGWQMVAVSTSPLLGQVQQDVTVVQFGELLGSGSFGRVYRAQWAGQDCAVKIIEHDYDALEAVEAEAQLMLSFDHPNLVRAYHYVTYKQNMPARASSCGHSHTGTGSNGSHRKLVGSKAASDQTLDSQAPADLQQPAAAVVGRTNSITGVLVDRANSITGGVRQHQQLPRQLLHQQSIDAVVGVSGSEGSAAGGSQGSRGSHPSGGDSKWEVGPGVDSVKCETWLVQEYCDVGTLGSVAAHSWSPLHESDEQMLQRLLLLQDTAMGLAALHEEATVHGDLNARNVLVSSSSTTPSGMVAKLADLGLSRVIKQHRTHRTTQTVGTMSHMPPELLRYGRLSAAVDVYSFAILMWEVYTCRAAFDKLHYGQFFETVVLQNLRPIVPQSMPLDYQTLMKQCWAADPADRPGVKQLLACIDKMIKVRQRRLSNSNNNLPAVPGSPSSLQAVCAILGVELPQQQQQEQQPAHVHTASSEAPGSPTAVSSAGWQGFVPVGPVMGSGADQLTSAGVVTSGAGGTNVRGAQGSWPHSSRHDSVNSSGEEDLNVTAGNHRYQTTTWFV